MSEFKENYKKNLEKFRQLEEEAKYCLGKWMKEFDIKTHSIVSRTKTRESYLDKVKKFQEGERNPSEIYDIVGLRVVCLFMEDIARIGKVIADQFEVVSFDSKIQDQEDHIFGYMSDHYIVRLKSDYTGPRYNDIKPFAFEIQVRTIAMDAWASISHHLSYKTDNDIPKNLRKSFHALSALFYVADKSFESLHVAKEISGKEIVEKIDKHDFDLDLNYDTLHAFAVKRFPERVDPESNYSELLNELIASGITKVGDLEEKLRGKEQDLFKDEDVNKKGRYLKANGLFYSDIGAIRIILKLTYPPFQGVYESKYKKLKEVGESI